MKPIMYLLRAMPGAGKSTIIERYKLKSNTISLDTFREMFSGLSIGVNGEEGIDQKHNEYIMSHFWDAVRFRMKERATIVIDNLNLRVSDINDYVKLAEGYGYEVKVVNFPLEDVDFYLKRNRGREERKRLPENRLIEIHEKFKTTCLNECKADVLDLEGFELIMSLANKEKAAPLDNYKNIVVIGDIYGAGEAFNHVVPHFNQDFFYIFTGAFFGDCEGYEKIFHSLILGHELDNVILLKSNKDIGFVYGENSILNEMEKKEYGKILDSTVPYFMFSYNNEYYFVSHAGVSKVPRNPELINASVFTKAQDVIDIDNHFDQNSEDGWFQIHGGIKREENINSIQPKSFSLYDHVEKGGYIDLLNINKHGLSFEKILNHKASQKAIKDYYQMTFKNFSKSTPIELERLKRTGTKGELQVYEDKDNNYYVYDSVIVKIESKKKTQITVAFEDVERMTLSYSKHSGQYYLFNEYGERQHFDIFSFNQNEIHFALSHDCLLDIISKDGIRYVVGGIKKDKERNRIKTKNFKEAPVKTLSFDNEKAFKGFKKGMKKSNKAFYLI